jgi:hypothetical protein
MNDQFNRALNISGLIIILLILGVLGYLCIYSINNSYRPENVYELHTKIILPEYKIPLKDSAAYVVNKNFILRFNSLVDSLNNQITLIKEAKKEIDEIDKKNGETFRLLLTLISAIFAIVGFFGFRSIFEMRTQAVERAGLEAKMEAGKIAKEIAKTAVDTEFDRFFKEARKTYELEINGLKDDISELESRLSGLEVSIRQRQMPSEESSLNAESPEASATAEAASTEAETKEKTERLSQKLKEEKEEADTNDEDSLPFDEKPE